MEYSEIELPSNKKFGSFFTAVFSALGLYFYFSGSIIFCYVMLGSAILFFCITIVNADLLHPLNALWMKLGFLLGAIVSPIVLGLIFFGIFTPISLLTKMFGRDELRLKTNSRISHWKERSSHELPTDRFKQQF